MVKNDAPLSVLRGFSKAELETMMKMAFADDLKPDYSINWKWAFRWLLIAHKKTQGLENG